MTHWLTEQVADNHQAEMRQRAREVHLAQEVLAAHRKKRVFYAPIMTRLGERLIAFGSYLKGRYGSYQHDYGAPPLPEPSPR